jgi:hypothetical protein
MITWTISQLDRRTSDGFVTTAHWRATAVDGDYSASVYSTCSWSEGQPTIPYADLTEEEVLEWIWDSGVDKDATEQSLEDRIEALKNPASEVGVPW